MILFISVVLIVMSSISFLILLILDLTLSFQISLVKDLSTLCIFRKPALSFIDIFYYFSGLYFISPLIFVNSRCLNNAILVNVFLLWLWWDSVRTKLLFLFIIHRFCLKLQNLLMLSGFLLCFLTFYNFGLNLFFSSSLRCTVRLFEIFLAF